MARTREFSPPEALDKAMRVFWEKGYFGTSIEDLVSATGVSRYGLYDEFGNKRGLFLAALEHYQDSFIRRMFGSVEQPDASLDAIRGFFAMLAEFCRQPAGKLGCLMCNTASEVAPHDAGAAQKVNDFRERLSAGFRHALSNAKEKGELHANFDVAREADFLSGIMHALPVLTRSGADRDMIENMVSVALSTLK